MDFSNSHFVYDVSPPDPTPSSNFIQYVFEKLVLVCMLLCFFFFSGLLQFFCVQNNFIYHLGGERN